MQVTVQPVQMGRPLVMIAEPKPESYLVMSIVVLACCNLIFGLIALLVSLQSDKAYQEGDIEGAREKGKCAFRLNVAGILMTIVTVVIVVIFYVVYIAAVLSVYAR